MALTEKLLNKLLCPKCHKDLHHNESKSSLECTECKIRFRITDDVPVLLLDEAETIDE